jgi:hypothetical protein
LATDDRTLHQRHALFARAVSRLAGQLVTYIVYLPLLVIDTILSVYAKCFEEKAAQAVISLGRFSNKSPRR